MLFFCENADFQSHIFHDFFLQWVRVCSLCIFHEEDYPFVSDSRGFVAFRTGRYQMSWTMHADNQKKAEKLTGWVRCKAQAYEVNTSFLFL